MARQQFLVAPYVKHLEVFNDFSGGLNTTTTNDKLKNNELTNLINFDLGDRGALKRRWGMVEHINSKVKGKAQGYFRYYTGTSFKEIVAVSGQFEVDGAVMPITGLSSFQTTRPIEGVQFGDKMYFATGTNLVEFDGTSFKVVEPYKPQPLEALYIGTNGLADDPNNYLQDGVGTFLRLDGVTFSKRYGILNETFTLTAFSTIPAGMQIEYLFEWRTPFMEDGFWAEGQDWSSSKSWTYKADFEGDMQFRISARQKGLEVAEVQYLVPKYKIKPAPDPNDLDVDVSNIKRCNRIKLHWGRLVLYGDEMNPDTAYFSHLNNPAYFPVPNSLRFLNPRREGLTSIESFRDMLVAFTDTSTQALFGKSPTDFRRVMLNTSIGCIAPYSTAVMKNYIAFLSQEGVHILKSIGSVEDRANVEKIDIKVDNLVTRSKDACGAFINGQYHLVFPSENKRLRFYFDLGAWTKDESPRLDFSRMFVFGDKLYGQSANGDVFVFDKIAKDDAGIPFDDVMEIKNLDFGQPYHRKKLKELHVLVSPKEETIKANIYVYANSALVLNPGEGQAVVNENGEVVWVANFDPNLVAQSGAVLGEWIMGENPFGEVETVVDKLSISGSCLRTRFKIENGHHVLGFAYVFKMKKP